MGLKSSWNGWPYRTIRQQPRPKVHPWPYMSTLSSHIGTYMKAHGGAMRWDCAVVCFVAMVTREGRSMTVSISYGINRKVIPIHPIASPRPFLSLLYMQIKVERRHCITIYMGRIYIISKNNRDNWTRFHYTRPSRFWNKRSTVVSFSGHFSLRSHWSTFIFFICSAAR